MEAYEHRLEEARGLSAKTHLDGTLSRVRRPWGSPRPLGTASHTAFRLGHCQVGPQVGTWWLAVSLGDFLVFMGP